MKKLVGRILGRLVVWALTFPEVRKALPPIDADDVDGLDSYVESGVEKYISNQAWLSTGDIKDFESDVNSLLHDLIASKELSAGDIDGLEDMVEEIVDKLVNGSFGQEMVNHMVDQILDLNRKDSHLGRKWDEVMARHSKSTA